MSVLNTEGEAEGRNQLNAEGCHYLHPSSQNIIGALKYSSTRGGRGGGSVGSNSGSNVEINFSPKPRKVIS